MVSSSYFLSQLVFSLFQWAVKKAETITSKGWRSKSGGKELEKAKGRGYGKRERRWMGSRSIQRWYFVLEQSVQQDTAACSTNDFFFSPDEKKQAASRIFKPPMMVDKLFLALRFFLFIVSIPEFMSKAFKITRMWLYSKQIIDATKSGGLNMKNDVFLKL